jgi:hypothetical protein
MGRIYNELSEVTVTVNPFDTNGNAFTPTTARFRVDDCLTEKELIAWTDIAVPSSAMQISIPGSINAIIGDRRTPEPKIVTVNTDNGLSTQHFEQYTYRVRDLAFAQIA